MDRRVLVKTRANFSLFIIRKAKLSHEGNYSCVASNLAGKRESGIIKLTVYGKYTCTMPGFNFISSKEICYIFVIAL